MGLEPGGVDAQLADAFSLQAIPEDFHADPYRYYRALRSHCPIKHMSDGSLFLTRHADLEYVYRNPALFSSDKREEFRPRFGAGLVYEHHTTSLVFNDPPLHTHVRRVLQGALAPRAISYMEPQLLDLVDGLLDAAAERERIDLIEDFAAAIPLEVIGNLLGVPHAERGPLRRWSLLILGALEPVVPPAQLAAAETAIREFLNYLACLIAERRNRLLDPDVDVLSRLILGERNGERLNETQLMHNCIFLLNAGHETTTNFIGNALGLMLRHPSQKRSLIENPGLFPTALDEFLRYESPNQLGNRRIVEDCELGGQTVAAGTLLTLCIGAANRDPARFDDPERLDLGRSPNRHLAFAGGTHLCLGMNLARLEARIAISRFLARFPDVTADDDPVLGRRVRFRGYAHLPVRLR